MVESLGFNGYILPSRLISLDCLKGLFSQPIMVEFSQQWSSQLFIKRLRIYESHIFELWIKT